MAQRATRLLMTTDAVGGVWQYSIELARALRPLGFETVLAVLGPAPAPEQRLAVRRMAGIKLVETQLPLDWLSEEASVRAAGVELAALARRHKVDIVHLNSPALAGVTRWPVPVVGVAHGCVATWWEAARPAERLAPEFEWHREMMAAGLRACDLVIAPSESFARTLGRVYALAQQPSVVHNGRRLPERVRAVPATNSALTVGRLWDEVKNLATLDAAAGQLNYPFCAAGDTTAPHGASVGARHLHLLGGLSAPALAEHVARRPVFVSAATFEPFGLAVLEAAAARCALVLSDIPTFRELWDGAALFVDPHDSAGFASAIERCLGDADTRDAMGEAAQARSLAYTPERMASATAHNYRQLLAARLAA